MLLLLLRSLRSMCKKQNQLVSTMILLCVRSRIMCCIAHIICCVRHHTGNYELRVVYTPVCARECSCVCMCVQNICILTPFAAAGQPLHLAGSIIVRSKAPPNWELPLRVHFQ